MGMSADVGGRDQGGSAWGSDGVAGGGWGGFGGEEHMPKASLSKSSDSIVPITIEDGFGLWF